MVTLDRRQFLAVSGAAVLGAEIVKATAQPSANVPWHQTDYEVAALVTA